MTDLKLHILNMSFVLRFLRSKKQNHYVKEKICFYVIMSKKYKFFSLLSVFSFGDVFADREVALVATLGDEMLVEGF